MEIGERSRRFFETNTCVASFEQGLADFNPARST
jgi:hypothetical protein